MIRTEPRNLSFLNAVDYRRSTIRPPPKSQISGYRFKLVDTRIFNPLLCQLSYLALKGGEEQGIWNAEVPAQASSSRTIEIDRINLAVMAVHVQSDGTAANFAILDRGKRAE
jgi:hypothetical protein